MNKVKLPHYGLYGTPTSRGLNIIGAATLTAAGAKLLAGADILGSIKQSDLFNKLEDFLTDILGWKCKGNASWCPSRADEYLKKLLDRFKEKYGIENISDYSAQENINNLNRMMMDIYSIRTHINSFIGSKRDETLKGLRHYLDGLNELEAKITPAYREYFKSIGMQMSSAGRKTAPGTLSHIQEYWGKSVTYPVYQVSGSGLFKKGIDVINDIITNESGNKQNDINNYNPSNKVKTGNWEGKEQTAGFGGVTGLLVGGMIVTSVIAWQINKNKKSK